MKKLIISIVAVCCSLTAWSDNIVFADDNVKALCVANWDTNNDGELSYEEAAAVTDLGTVFKNNKRITSLDELAYFTGLTSIGESAFSGCSNLTIVSIPSSMTSIGQNAFEGCNRLAAVNITDLKAWCNISFESAWANPVSIAGHLYLNGEELTKLDLPGGLTSIGQYAFQGCMNLKSLTIPMTVKTIGASAFRGSGLTSVTIPDNVTTLSNCSFAGCPNLKSVYIGSGVSSYDGSCFIDNQNLQSLVVSSENTVYDSRNECNAVIRKSDNHLLTGCNTTIIPEDVWTIEVWAFRGSKRLEQITIPASVISIQGQAFNDCPNLTTVKVISKNPPIVFASSSFSNRANATLYVPYGCRGAYLAADVWKDFKVIEEMNRPKGETMTTVPKTTVSPNDPTIDAAKKMANGLGFIDADYKVSKNLYGIVLDGVAYPTGEFQVKATLEIINFGTQGNTILMQLDLGSVLGPQVLGANKRYVTFSWSGKNVHCGPGYDSGAGILAIVRGNTICGYLANGEGKWIAAANTGGTTYTISDLKKGMTIAEVQKAWNLNYSQFKFVRNSGKLKVYSLLWLDQKKKYDIFGDYHYVLTNDKTYGEFYFDSNGKLVKWFLPW